MKSIRRVLSLLGLVPATAVGNGAACGVYTGVGELPQFRHLTSAAADQIDMTLSGTGLTDAMRAELTALLDKRDADLLKRIRRSLPAELARVKIFGIA
jgi:hypothetical protein